MAKIIDGKKLADEIKLELRKEIVRKDLAPGLAIILVGDNPASKLYVSLKKKAARALGIEFHEYLFSKDAEMPEVQELIEWLNKDSAIHGIVLQLPLPEHLNEDKLIAAIDPKKDADGFHPKNIKKLTNNAPYITPALSQAIMALLRETGETLSDKHAAVIVNSNILTQPLNYEFKKQNISSEYISPKAPNLKTRLQRADVVIVAIGRPHFLTDSDCKKDTIVIDVGISKENGKTVGDVDAPDYEKLKNISRISPVPGGVGPLTIAMLLKNVITLTEQQRYKK